MKKVIHHWHNKLDMPKHDLAWHQQDMADELQELEEAKGLIYKWSELSDVVYTCTRAHWSGHPEIIFPFSKARLYLGSVYMFPKYSLRWGFFRKLGKKFDKNLEIREVRNPEKLEKLEVIAKKYNLDPHRFKAEATKLMKKWVFLK